MNWFLPSMGNTFVREHVCFDDKLSTFVTFHPRLAPGLFLPSFFQGSVIASATFLNLHLFNLNKTSPDFLLAAPCTFLSDNMVVSWLLHLHLLRLELCQTGLVDT